MLILVVALVVLLYFSNIYSYSLGVKHGRIVKNDGVPDINPVKAVKEAKLHRKEQEEHDRIQEGLNNILNYGEPVK